MKPSILFSLKCKVFSPTFSVLQQSILEISNIIQVTFNFFFRVAPMTISLQLSHWIFWNFKDYFARKEHWHANCVHVVHTDKKKHFSIKQVQVGKQNWTIIRKRERERQAARCKTWIPKAQEWSTSLSTRRYFYFQCTTCETLKLESVGLWDGEMVLELITKKIKWELTWGMTTKKKLQRKPRRGASRAAALG